MSVDDRLEYQRFLELRDAPAEVLEARRPTEEPDQRSGLFYVYDAGLQLAAEIALVTGRPLLIRGDPGSGKSSFAAFIARNLDARYYEEVITARTQGQDLLYTYDTVRRLSDATNRGGAALNDFDYIQPGVLWWAMNRTSALHRGATESDRAPSTPALEPLGYVNAARRSDRAVVLVDEIDKADPDVPNDLLVAIGSYQFAVKEIGKLVTCDTLPGPISAGAVSTLLVVVTTNEERELSPAFVRRCVVHTLAAPSADTLCEIAARHFQHAQALSDDQKLLCRELALRIVELRDEAKESGDRSPSTAEFLDALRACVVLNIGRSSVTWAYLENYVLRKKGPGA